MNYMNYKTLLDIMKKQAPFRGTTNRFPLTKRSQSHKYFLHERDEKGEEVFRIIYGKRYETAPVTKEEYDANPNEYNKGQSLNDDGTITNTYYKHYMIPDEVGIVRTDNSFQFTKPWYGQGCMTFLSNFVPFGHFMRDGKRGGMMFVKGPWHARTVMLPIYKGMRIDCDTMQPDPKHSYRLLGRRVNRKNSKEFLKQYEDFFKISEAMMSNISLKVFAEACLDKLNELPDSYNKGNNTYWKYQFKNDKIIQRAKEIMNDSPLDAAALYCTSLGSTGIGNFRYIVSHFMVDGDSRFENVNVGDYFTAMKREVCNMLYRENPDVMSLVEYEFGKHYPQSNWGYTVEVDGVEVQQY